MRTQGTGVPEETTRRGSCYAIIPDAPVASLSGLYCQEDDDVLEWILRIPLG